MGHGGLFVGDLIESCTLFSLLQGFPSGFLLGKVFKEAVSVDSSISFEEACGHLW